MKRSEALSAIKHFGYINDLDEAIKIQLRKDISLAVTHKVFNAGKRLKELDLPCDCTDCTAKRGGQE